MKQAENVIRITNYVYVTITVQQLWSVTEQRRNNDDDVSG